MKQLPRSAYHSSAFLWSATLVVAASCAPADLDLAVDFTPDQLQVIASMTRESTDFASDDSNRFGSIPRVAALGKKLFFDPRLSGDGSVACATCHDPKRSWSDGKPVAVGAGKGTRNTPSLWNTGFGRWFFWDGRADSLWAQALRPLETEHEMASSRLAVLRTISRDVTLKRDYEAIFGALPELPTDVAHASPRGDARARAAWEQLPLASRDEIDTAFAKVGKAIAAFEHTIVSHDSAFDRFARGVRDHDPQRIADAGFSGAAQRGLALFLGRANCILCHHGPDLTDYEFHNLGLLSEEQARAAKNIDTGRYNGIEVVQQDVFRGLAKHSDNASEASNRHLTFVERRLSNMGEFKTPSLRNVVRTAPYMHDGSMATLDDVLEFYSELPGRTPLGHREESLLPLKLSEGERTDLRAFLESLTDESALPKLVPNDG